ncbi:hypothetical protein QQ045_006961 [Rhodiola kirilowii]
MKIIDRHSISPPSGSVPPTTIPLSFLDVFWLYANPVKRVFLYKFPSISTQHFLQNILPSLKHSLSLALKYFFPVAGSLVLQPNSRPYIRYDQGCSVALTVAESDEDFEHLVNRDGKMIHDASFSELVPTISKDEVLFGIQVTVFPNSGGICIGIACKHVLGDGRSIMHFLRTWSSIFRNSNDDFVPPVLDRSLVPDPGGVLHDTLLKQLTSIPPSSIENLQQPKEATGMIKVRATFSIKRSEINKMREWILSQVEDGENLHLSSFVLTCSLIWICLVKSQSATGSSNGDDVKDDDQCSFGFTFDCCDRYEYHSIVPATYFGNCLCLGGLTSAKRIDLQGESGLIVAVKAIGKTIKDLVAKGPTKDADKWLSGASEIFENMHNTLTVAGSPRLGVYGLDFGWGKPEKVEVVSIEFPKAVSMAELRDEVGGIEAALVLDQPQMEAFIGIFEESKAKYCLWESTPRNCSRVLKRAYFTTRRGLHCSNVADINFGPNTFGLLDKH